MFYYMFYYLFCNIASTTTGSIALFSRIFFDDLWVCLGVRHRPYPTGTHGLEIFQHRLSCVPSNLSSPGAIQHRISCVPLASWLIIFTGSLLSFVPVEPLSTWPVFSFQLLFSLSASLSSCVLFRTFLIVPLAL